MSWFWIALVTPFTHAIVNHVDKYLISKYLKKGQVGSLVLFSSLFAIFALPIILLINPDVVSVSLRDATLLMINGALLVVAYIAYFYALEQDETSFVVPLYQMVPVLSFVLGYFVLGEKLMQNQIWGSLLIVAGVVVLSLDFKNIKTGLKKKVFLFMSISSLCYALNGVFFKFITETQQKFLPSLFWDFVGKIFFGILIFIFIASYRKQFIGVLKENKFSIITLNSINELLGIIGEIAIVFALLLAPVALVQIVGGLQSVFAFLFGIILTFLFPSIAQESLTKKILLQKTVGIGIIIIGAIYIQ